MLCGAPQCKWGGAPTLQPQLSHLIPPYADLEVCKKKPLTGVNISLKSSFTSTKAETIVCWICLLLHLLVTEHTHSTVSTKASVILTRFFILQDVSPERRIPWLTSLVMIPDNRDSVIFVWKSLASWADSESLMIWPSIFSKPSRLWCDILSVALMSNWNKRLRLLFSPGHLDLYSIRNLYQLGILFLFYQREGQTEDQIENFQGGHLNALLWIPFFSPELHLSINPCLAGHSGQLSFQQGFLALCPQPVFHSNNFPFLSPARSLGSCKMSSEPEQHPAPEETAVGEGD